MKLAVASGFSVNVSVTGRLPRAVKVVVMVVSPGAKSTSADIYVAGICTAFS